MKRMARVSLIALAILSQGLAAAGTTPTCELQQRGIAAIIGAVTRQDNVVTAPVSLPAYPLNVGDSITVSGIVDGSYTSFNGGPFTVHTLPFTIDHQVYLQWDQVAENVDSAGNTFDAAIFFAPATNNVIVKFSGNSAQFSISPASDKNYTYTFSYGSLSELVCSSNSGVISCNGSIQKGHSGNISGNGFGWSQPFTNGTYTLVQLCGGLPIGDRFVSLMADHFVYFAPATAQDGSQSVPVAADSLKFDLSVPAGWPFASPTNRLQMQMDIKVPSQIDDVQLEYDTYNKSITKMSLTLRQGPGLEITFPATALLDKDTTLVRTVTSADGYSVDAKVTNTGIQLFLTFPSFAGRLNWDPVIRVVQ